MTVPRLKKGNQITEARWNAHVDAINGLQRIASDGSLNIKQVPGGGILLGLSPQPSGIPIYNASGATIPPYAILQPSGGIQVYGRDAYTKVVKPNTSYRGRYLINGDQYIDNTRIGFAQDSSSSIYQALFDSGTPGDGDLWGVQDSTWGLVSNGLGSWRSLGTVDATSKLMILEWGPIPLLYGKPESDVTTGAGTFDIYTDISFATACTGSPTVSATSPGAGVTIKSGKKAYLLWDGKAWLAQPLECST